MTFKAQLNIPGDHPFVFEGATGTLEGISTVPTKLRQQWVAFLGHPHSLQGGTMNNKVVTTLARSFKEIGIPSLRFNFRGVGQSMGQYDEGIGESEDLLILTTQYLKEQPAASCIFAGFSFGSYVTYRAAAQQKSALLISIAPPVHHYDYREFSPSPEPWLIVQGDEDEVVPPALVYDFVDESQPAPRLIRLDKSGHFFHGRLLDLKSQLLQVLSEQLDLS